MKKLFSFILYTLIILNLKIIGAYAANGPTSIYKITMEKIEFCTGYSVTDFDDIATASSACQNAITIGTGSSQVDIASVGAGAAAAAYGDTKLLPLGTTFTHLRVTINRKFMIKSTGDIDTGSSADTDKCRTIATTNAHYGTTIAARKYTHRIVVAEEGTHAEMELYAANGGKKGDTSNNVKLCDDASCGTPADANWQFPDASELNSAVAMETMNSSSGDTMSLIYKFENPITVGMVTPKVDIAFGTQQAVGVEEQNSLCHFYPAEPRVKITVQ